MKIKRRWRRVVVWAVAVGSFVAVTLQGWQALLSVAAIALGFGIMQALLRWEKRGQ